MGPILEIRGTEGVMRWSSSQIIHCDARGERVFAGCSDPSSLRRHLLDTVLDRLKGVPVFYCDLDMAGRQTLISNTAFEIAPIHTIAGADLSPSPERPGEFFIRGIERDCLQAFEEEKLWSETSAAWAVAPSRIRLGSSLDASQPSLAASVR